MHDRETEESDTTMLVLAGDIGGTHARLALIRVDGRSWTIERQRTYPSEAYGGLAPIVQAFLAEHDAVPDQASFGVACPVGEGVCRLPNLDWELDVGDLRREIAIPRTDLLNDFTAIAHAIPLLRPDGWTELQAGRRGDRAPIGVIGAGTGLGQAALLWRGDRYDVYESEGGHADFAPRTRVECDLLAALQDRYGHVSYERVVSGPGLVNIYEFLTAGGVVPERPSVRNEIDRGDAAAVIAHHAIAGDDPACGQALQLFVSVYGAQAGNLALTLRAGTIYVAGGIAPRILDRLRDGTFVTAFRDKGRLSALVETVPIRVIVTPHVGLIGAAAAAQRA